LTHGVLDCLPQFLRFAAVNRSGGAAGLIEGGAARHLLN